MFHTAKVFISHRVSRIAAIACLAMAPVTRAAGPVQDPASTVPSGTNQPAQYKRMITVRRMKETGKLDRTAILNQASSGATIPLWNYNVVSPLDGSTYQGTMVGRSPFFNGHRTTTVSTYLIPVRLTFADTGTVFDPTATDSCLGESVLKVVAQSPMFENVAYTMNSVNVGSTQYVDAFQRANFWKQVEGTPYHTLLGLKTLPAVSVTVPVANGSSSNFGCPYGTMDINWWDTYVQSALLPQLASQGVGPSVFPIFLFDSVFEYEGTPSQCCILGYHSAYLKNGLLQTYSISSYDTSGTFGGDISVSSHEIAEWMDDPDTNNPTPAWGHVGQVPNGCQANLEVGDPLTGTEFGTVTLNGNTYTLQELAFFSWFFRQSPSIGSGGLYSNNGSFIVPQEFVCQ